MSSNALTVHITMTPEIAAAIAEARAARARVRIQLTDALDALTGTPDAERLARARGDICKALDAVRETPMDPRVELRAVRH